jgi:hypothetical protein
MLLKAFTVPVTLALSALVLSAVGFQSKVSAPRFGKSLEMTAKGPKFKPKDNAMSPALAPSTFTKVWVKFSRENDGKVFAIKSASDGEDIDDLKELVKIKCSATLNGIDAMMLEIKGSDGSALRPGILLSSRPEGKSDEDPFVVEVPKSGNILILIL